MNLQARFARLASQQASIAAEMAMLAGEMEQGGQDRLLTVREAAEALRCSTDHLYDLAAELSFTRRVGRKLMFSEAGIQEYLRQGA